MPAAGFLRDESVDAAPTQPTDTFCTSIRVSEDAHRSTARAVYLDWARAGRRERTRDIVIAAIDRRRVRV